MRGHMSNVDEIETKFWVVDGNADVFTKDLMCGLETRVVDQYYDTFDGKYYQNGIYIRLRNNNSLDIKFNPEHLHVEASKTQLDHVFCHEYNFPVPFSEA